MKFEHYPLLLIPFFVFTVVPGCRILPTIIEGKSVSKGRAALNAFCVLVGLASLVLVFKGIAIDYNKEIAEGTEKNPPRLMGKEETLLSTIDTNKLSFDADGTLLYTYTPIYSEPPIIYRVVNSPNSECKLVHEKYRIEHISLIYYREYDRYELFLDSETYNKALEAVTSRSILHIGSGAE